MAAKSQSNSKDQPHYTQAGATLLSEQPVDADIAEPSDKDLKAWHVLKGHLEARLSSLRTWRSSWWFQNWSELAQYIDPKRSIWLTQSMGGLPSPNNNTRGRQINNSIVDPTGTYAVRVCSSGMMSGLASPSRPWFKIMPSIKGIQLDAAGKAWLDEVEDRVYTVLANSNFYKSIAQEMEDLVVFGTAPCIIYEDEKDIIRCYNPTVGEYYLASGSTMRVEGLYRAFVMTIAQIVDFFGLDVCPEDVVKLWNQKGSALETERIIAHSIEPNFEIKKGIGKVPGNFAWREVYWIYGSGSPQPLSMNGFVEQPFTAPRWMTQSNDAYGRSVGMDVLPDIIQLQVETLRKAEAIEKMVRPPLVADMQLKNMPSSILPGAVTYIQNLGQSGGMRPIFDVNPRIGEMMQDIAEIQNRIKVGFFNDVIMMLSTNPGDRRTAYEVAELASERLQVLGPVIENILNESLKPRLTRVFAIMKRRDMLPPMPESMKGIVLDVEFTSMLALAQKGAATGGMERLAAIIGNMTAVFPEARNKLNVNNYIDTMNALLDNPASVLYSNEEVEKMLAAQNEAAQGEKDMMAAGAMAQTAKTGADAAKVLSETQVGAGQNALAQLLS